MEMASIILGVVGLILTAATLPTVFQMIFGRPHLSFSTDEFSGPDARILLFALKNEEVKSHFLRFLRVERESREVQVFFDVQEQGTNRFLIRSASGLLNDVARQDIGLRTEAAPGFTIGVTIIVTRNGIAHIVEGRTNDHVPIPQGHYIAYVTALCGNRQYLFRTEFQVGAQDYQTIWAVRGPLHPVKGR